MLEIRGKMGTSSIAMFKVRYNKTVKKGNKVYMSISRTGHNHHWEYVHIDDVVMIGQELITL